MILDRLDDPATGYPTGRQTKATLVSQALFKFEPQSQPSYSWVRRECLEVYVTVGNFRDLLWYTALISGCLAITLVAGGWYARRKFRTFLKAPLTEEAEHLTHVWERRVTRWTVIGLALSGVSILCSVSWLISGHIL